MLQKITKAYKSIVFIALLICSGITFASALPSKIDFWERQQKGANIFNREITSEDIGTVKKDLIMR